MKPGARPATVHPRPRLRLVKQAKVVPTVKRHTNVRPELKTTASPSLASTHPVFGGTGEAQRPNRRA
jgi:hypothetical protein